MAQNDCKYVTIRVRDSKVPAGKNGRILMYDADGDFYYMTTMADAFESYEKVIASLCEKFSAEISEARTKYGNDIRAILEDNERFKAEATERYNSLLATVKDVNEKVLRMVDKSEEGHDI